VPRVALNRAAAQCPLWVKSRHCLDQSGCPLYPRKLTSMSAIAMSALCQKRTSGQTLLTIASLLFTASRFTHLEETCGKQVRS
jgi:hypothetical protein